jgi:hypothetical protein
LGTSGLLGGGCQRLLAEFLLLLDRLDVLLLLVKALTTGLNQISQLIKDLNSKVSHSSERVFLDPDDLPEEFDSL